MTVRTERENIIINNLSGIFDVDNNSNADEKWGEWRTINKFGIDAVKQYEAIIDRIAVEKGVNADWVKAIMYLETAQGYDDMIIPDKYENTAQPMNINTEKWGQLLGYTREEIFNDAEKNIELGVELIKRITSKLAPEDQTLEKVAALYNDLGENEVNDYGARVQNIYDNQLWTDPKDYDYETVIEKLIKVATGQDTDIDLNQIKEYLANIPAIEGVKSIIDAQLDFLNAQGLSTRWALHDPLVMDLDGDGIELTNIENSTAYFDIDGDGIAERTGWVKSDDGILVRDINGNGKIDDINELFGNKTVSGIDALKTLDTNNDGKISELDEEFESVKVWQDLNGNGISEDGELKSLTELGITGINLNSTKTDETIEGNKIDSTTTYTKTDGTSGQVGNVDFLVDQVNTIYRGEYDLNLDTLFFPNSRGYGDLKPLHVAMSEDTVLFGMMKEITEMSKEDVLSWNETIQNILYRWAGVEGIDSSSRGAEFDAKKLEFLEKFFGESFLSETGAWGTGENNPAGTKACELLEKAWLEIFNIMSTKIIAQSLLKEIIPEVSYDFATDKIQINSSFDEIAPKTNAFTENMSEFEKLIIGSYVQKILLENKVEFEEENIDTKISEFMIEEFGTSAKINYVGKVSDNLYGTESDELFLIGKGSGYKTIIETGGNDSIRLGEGLSETDMLLYKNQNDLLIRFKDSEGNLTNDVVKNLKIA